MSTVEEFLEGLGLGRYVSAFQEAGYDDLDVVLAMEDGDFDHVKMLPGHRKKLELAIRQGGSLGGSTRTSVPVSTMASRTPQQASTPSPRDMSGTRRSFGGATYAPRGNMTASFQAPAYDTSPAAGISRRQQEVATANLAMGGTGVATRREGDPASRAPATAGFMYGGGVGGGSARGGAGGNYNNNNASSQYGQQQRGAEPERVRVQNGGTGGGSARPSFLKTSDAGAGAGAGAMNSTRSFGAGSGSSPASAGTSPHRHIAVAAPGTVDTKSNYSSSDNPLATGYVNTRPTQRPGDTDRYVKFAAPEGSPVSSTSNVASEANPLAPVHRVGPKRPAIKTFTGRKNDHTSTPPSATARVADPDEGFRGYVKFAAPDGTVSGSSNVASASNPLAPVHKVYEKPQPRKGIQVALVPRG